VILFTESLHKNLKEVVHLYNVQYATTSERGKEERERKQRCRETSAISCHTKGCQVLLIYIDDLMMIV